MINNAGIVRYAIVSCQPKDGVKLFQLANNQSAVRSPYTGPSKSGNHKNDSSNCFVVAKFKNDLYNATNTGIWANAGKQPASGFTLASEYNNATNWFCNSLLSGYLSLISLTLGVNAWVFCVDANWLYEA